MWLVHLRSASEVRLVETRNQRLFLVMVISFAVYFGYVFCFNLSLDVSRSNYPCHFVNGYASVVFGSIRWTIEGAWCPMTRDDLARKSDL